MHAEYNSSSAEEEDKTQKTKLSQAVNTHSALSWLDTHHRGIGL